ncbi:MAG: ABC transporter substrate-binding protein [Thermoflexaceae bacterium]|nr:ABC transporter substrate-binding protein [Thermoflexaceae bacterium]
MADNERNYWARASRRYSRRTVVRGAGLAGLGAGAAALIGCGDDDDDTGGTATSAATTASGTGTAAASATTAAAAQPKSGGTFTRHITTQPRSLDYDFDVFVPMANHTNNALLKFNEPVTEIQVDAAAALPEQPDDLTYVFKLTPGIKFQNLDPVNGRELTSEDVKFSIERQMTDEAGKFQHAYFYRGKVDHIETPDKQTVVVKMSRKFAPFLAYAANAWSLITAPEIISKFGDLTQNMVGTGPFIFKGWQKDVRLDFEKNPDYFRKGKPYIDKLAYLVAVDPDVAATLFIEKKVDAVSLTAQQGPRVKDGRKDATYRAQPQQGMAIMRMPPTLADQPYEAPYNDIRVREAVVRSVNKKEIYELVYSGQGIPATGPMPPAYTAWALKEDPAPQDLKKAQDLMKAAGLENGFSEKFIWATSASSDQAAEVIKQHLAKIKVTADLQPMETAAYYNLIYTYKYGMSFHNTTSTPDPDEALAAYYGPTSTYYKYYGKDNGIWDEIDKQSQELDTKARKVLVDAVQKKIVEQYPVAFLFSQLLQQFIDPKVKGWFYSIDGYNHRVEDLWLDG